ncbi:MAG: preprotein translocase subunit SecE [Proteobacteria bacterium]|nr:preprotein translocase subunit SecE [Pseudomonadota bacterium]MBU4287687.1 preprotein translocase subunit SecE [Pseudomonadota bacterium]MCG2756981.1 preprotein translocase subunit SecE [Desulfobacteraceae bacterium]
MGKLQRKKSSAGKKKKKQSVDRAPSSKAGINAATQKTGLISDSVRVIKKAQTLSLKKSSSTVRSESRKLEGNFLGRLFVARSLQKSLQFLREVKVELNKVTWPTRKQTIGSTLVVIILVMIISFFLGIVDIGLSSLIGVVLK